jgi:dipeptidyl aminopeptidase/acylaminoacyl peptidase
MEQVAKFSFPSGLTSSPVENQIAWAMNEQGKRNVYIANGPNFKPEKLTNFNEDDGQEISSLQYSPDGKFLVFVRGGDHGGGNASQPVNPTHNIQMPKVEVWKIDLGSKNVTMIGEGDNPVIGTPHLLVYLKNGQVLSQNIEEEASQKPLFETKGNISSLEFSPDGTQIAFIDNRSGHSLVGVYQISNEHLKWLSPGFYSDQSPRWSPDGKQIVFIRTPGGSGASLALLEQRHSPWEIWIADVSTGEGYKRRKSPETLRGSVPTVDGRYNLHWAANNNIVYLSYEDGWPHLYTMGAKNGASKLLTPGDYHVEHIKLSPDKKSLIFSANYGPEPQDLDRRHIGKVEINGAGVEWLTGGKGIEAYPVFIGESDNVAYLSATAKRPLLPAVQWAGKELLLGEDLIPKDFPQEQLVEPKQVSFMAPDGVKVYGQLFEKEGGEKKKPGVVFVHGGPQRQMLLGWSYMDYYSNTYAVNQYLANLGFVVLSVNYRLGIGYGYEFHKPENTYYKGAGEYQDVKAAGEFLADLLQVDPNRIGIYGGSYGGYLTALALGKDSDLFKVGVDIHGVHNFEGRYSVPEGFEVAPDYEVAKKIAWESSPFAFLDSWKSPVLFIHGDDDRNVNVSHTTDLIRRFEEKNMPYKYLMIPDETHHWMKFSNMVKVDKATANFLEEYLIK